MHNFNKSNFDCIVVFRMKKIRKIKKKIRIFNTFKKNYI